MSTEAAPAIETELADVRRILSLRRKQRQQHADQVVAHDAEIVEMEAKEKALVAKLPKPPTKK